MRLSNWLRQLKSNVGGVDRFIKSNRRRTNHPQPAAEVFEQRLVLSTISLANGVLSIALNDTEYDVSVYSGQSSAEILIAVDNVVVHSADALDVDTISIVANDQPNFVDASGLALGAVTNVSIELGAGDDTAIGSMASETILGGDGDDLIFAGGRPDYVDAGAGDDTVSGNGGNDSLDGGSGDDSLLGQAGEDIIDAGLGSDMIDGVVASGSSENSDTLGRDSVSAKGMCISVGVLV